MFDSSTRCVVVVGAQWGDEGKGKVVDVLAETADLVVRYQGGANAGHTVDTGDDSIVLHQIPSGILHGGTRCIIGNGVVLNCQTLLDEIEELGARGVSVSGRLLVSDRAHLVFPFHCMLDRAKDEAENIGTTGRGIGPTYEGKAGRRNLRVTDLTNPASARDRVENLVRNANARLEMAGSDDRASVEEHIALIGTWADALRPYICDTGLVIDEARRQRQKILLEGAQGALLDVDHGTYPYVTSSNTTAGAAAVGSGIGPTAIDAVLGVVKAYATRVGNGPLPTEADPTMSERLRTLGGEFGATTGRPRRCGWFDAVALRYAARVNGLTHLAITKLDVLDTLERIPICVRYRLDGKDFDQIPAEPTTLDRTEPVYEEFPGWQSPTTEARSVDHLPVQARSYIERLEDLVGVPIRYVSVGTRRDQFIDLS